MADIYFKKKEQMKSPARQNVVDATVELEKKRSASPIVLGRERSVGACVQKVCYKHELESVRNEVSAVQKDIEALVNDLKAQVDKLNKQFESVKYENLKNQLNDSVSKQNENIKNITAELVNMMDKINAVDSKVASIEEVL